jgi:hypothetical protein
VAEPILELAEVRELDRARRIVEFRKHPMFKELAAEFADRKNDRVQHLGAEVLRGNVDQLRAAEEKGYWRGVRDVLEGTPTKPPRRRERGETSE